MTQIPSQTCHRPRVELSVWVIDKPDAESPADADRLNLETREEFSRSNRESGEGSVGMRWKTDAPNAPWSYTSTNQNISPESIHLLTSGNILNGGSHPFMTLVHTSLKTIYYLNLTTWQTRLRATGGGRGQCMNVFPRPEPPSYHTIVHQKVIRLSDRPLLERCGL